MSRGIIAPSPLSNPQITTSTINVLYLWSMGLRIIGPDGKDKPFPMEYGEWQYWADSLDEIEELSQAEKRKVAKTFNYLDKLLGSDFLKDAMEANHPLIHILFNPVAWTRRWVIWLGESLQQVQDYENFDRVVKKLRNARSFDPTLLEVDFASRLGKTGFEVKFYPPVLHGKVKEADLKLHSPGTNENFFVEISTLSESKYEKEIWETFQSISHRLFFSSIASPRTKYSGKVYKYLSPIHLQDILTKLDNAFEKARTDGFSELSETGVIELGIARRDDHTLHLQSWAEERELRDSGLLGPSIDVDEIRRIASKIDEKQHQLPPDSLNVLILRNNSLFFGLRNPRVAMEALEEHIYRFEHLVVCYIFSSYMGGGGDREDMIHGQHLYVKQPWLNFHMEEGLVLTNRFIQQKTITPKCLTEIVRRLTLSV